MKKIRIGNDFTFKWTITRYSSTENLSAKALSCYLLDPHGKKATMSYTVQNNVITGVFAGADQSVVGAYTLILIENEGLSSMATIDKVQAFMLVPYSYMADDDGVVSVVTLSSELSIPSNGASAYQIAVAHGYTGTEEQWLASLVKPVNDFVTVATASENARVSAETSRASAETSRATAETARANAETERKNNETSRKSYETQRKNAEDARVSAETSRASAETSRSSAEEARVSAENARVTAETARREAESNRRDAETLRASAETARKTSEVNRTSAESGRVSAESARVSAENARVSAETARQSAETSRAAAETQRGTTFTTNEAARQATFDSKEAQRDAATATIAQEATKLTNLESKLVNNTTIQNTIPNYPYASYEQNSMVYDSSQNLPIGAKIKKVKCASTGTAPTKSTKIVVFNENNVQVSRNEIGTIGTTETEFDVSALGIVVREGYKYCVECSPYKWVSGVSNRYSRVSGGTTYAYNDYYFGFAFVVETETDRLNSIEASLEAVEGTTERLDTSVALLNPKKVGTETIDTEVAVEGYYVDASNNKTYASSSFDISDDIELGVGQTIKLTARGYNTAIGMISIYNNGAYETKVRSTDSDEHIYSYTATSICKVRVCYGKNYAHSVSIVTASPLLLRIDKIENSINGIVSNIEDSSINYPYMFTKIACVGDSLTRGYAGSNYQGDFGDLTTTYPYYFGKMTGANISNLGLSGRTTKQWYEEYNAQINFATYDCVIIYLGTNGGLTDTASTDINTSDYSQCADTNTGYYGRIIGKIKSESPKCSIFVVAGPNEYIRRTTSMNNAVRSIATKCGVFLLDLEECILSDNGSSTSVSRNTYRPIDGIHYNRLGYYTLSSVIFNKMKKYVSDHLISFA